MKMIQSVLLGQIELSDETFSVNFMPDLEGLRSSIEQIGLVQPVLLRKRGDRYQIICGFRRTWITLALGMETIEAGVYDEGDGDDLRLFSVSLHENLTGRGFNTVETALALDKLVHRFGVDRSAVIRNFLPLFSLETNEKILNTYLSLARMEEEVKKYVVKERVSRSNIRRLSSLSSEDRRAVVSLISPLKLGENSLREILSLVEEISRRDRQRIGDLVDRSDIQSILSHRELTPSQKTDRVKKVLLDIRYPQMRRLEGAFEVKRKALNLPPGLFVQHQPYFEGKGLKIELRFETLEEYRSLITSLSALAEKEEFQEMLEEKGY